MRNDISIKPEFTCQGLRIRSVSNSSRVNILECGHNTREEDGARQGALVAEWVNGAFREGVRRRVATSLTHAARPWSDVEPQE